MLPDNAARVLEEVGDAAGGEPAHPHPRLVRGRADHDPASRRRRLRPGPARIPRRPPLAHLGLGNRGRPQLQPVAVATVQLVRSVEASRRRTDAIHAGRDLRAARALLRRRPRERAGPTGCRGWHPPRVPAACVERGLLVPELERNRNLRVAHGPHSDDPPRRRGGARARGHPRRRRRESSSDRRRRTACTPRRSPSRP